MIEEIATDYLVVGCGAMGLAFVDSLVGHSDAQVVMVDRRPGPGGHWLDAYPFVRLHQASAFYGVSSTQLGDGKVQEAGPERGLHERAGAPEICAYYARVLQSMVDAGRVEFHSSCDYVGGREFVSRVSGRRYRVSPGSRLVDSTYLAPDIPARTPPPFRVEDGVRVVPVNDLVRLAEAPRRFVVVGSGKTATDACIWLLGNDVDPDAICWVRPRDPWMINRAALQPDPSVSLGTAGSFMIAAIAATSPDDMFLRLEDAGVMLRLDRSVTPSMAKTPVIGGWEVERLRTIGDVVRLGHVRHLEPRRMTLADGEVTLPANSLIVHCAAQGLKYPPPVAIWGRDAITVQPVRAGFPCFGAALIGYLEATRHDDEEKNRLCPPSTLPDTPTSWARMQVLGSRASQAFGSEPDVREWSNATSLNPARITPQQMDDPDVVAALERYRSALGAGLAKLGEFAGLSG